MNWIERNGKRILEVDYRGLATDDELILVLEAEASFLKGLSEPALVLGRFEDAHGGARFAAAANRLGREVRREKTLRSATLGIRGYKKTLLGLYVLATGDQNIRAFEKEEEAVAWLTGL